MNPPVVEKHGTRYFTLPPRKDFILGSRTVGDLIAECFTSGITRVLAEEGQLSEAFFDLRTQEAGEVLQKLRTYGIRLAVVIQGLRVLSEPCKKMILEESRRDEFGVFPDRHTAEQWLLR